MPKNDADRMVDAIAKARALLAEEAVPALTTLMYDMYGKGLAAWRLDPYVDNVVGFVAIDSNDAFVVVYLDDNDWELSERMEDNLAFWEAMQ